MIIGRATVFPSPTRPPETGVDTRDGKLYIFAHTAGECPQRKAWPSGRAFFVGVLMANSAPRPCNHPGCPTLVHGGSYCAKHAQIARLADTRRRGSSTQRGYGYRWQKASKAYLAHHPLCVYCQQSRRITAATVVDHIVPHRGDQQLFWDSSNWQSLCATCHNSRKQSEEQQPNTHP